MTKNIVLLHGWGGSPEKLEPLSKSLEKLGWSTQLVSFPGLSAPDPERAWDVSDYANYILTQISKKFAKEGYVLFGHSFGGRVAIKLAGRGQINKLVLCAPGGLSRPWSVKRLVFLILAKVGKVFALFPPLGNMYRKLLYKGAREHDYEKTSGIMRETFKNVVGELLIQDLDNISIPTLVMWGKVDRMVPYSDGELISKKISKSKLVLVEDQGHRLPYEKPSYLADEINTWFGGLVH